MKAKSRAVTVQQGPLLIHEVESKTSHHRIIIVEGGTADVGEWAESHELARHKGYLANLQSASHLPLGVFKTRGYPTQIVGY